MSVIDKLKATKLYDRVLETYPSGGGIDHTTSINALSNKNIVERISRFRLGDADYARMFLDVMDKLETYDTDGENSRASKLMLVLDTVRLAEPSLIRLARMSDTEFFEDFERNYNSKYYYLARMSKGYRVLEFASMQEAAMYRKEFLGNDTQNWVIKDKFEAIAYAKERTYRFTTEKYADGIE